MNHLLPAVQRRSFIKGLITSAGAITFGQMLSSHPATALTNPQVFATTSSLKQASYFTIVKWLGAHDAIIQIRQLNALGIWSQWKTITPWHDASVESATSNSGLINTKGALALEVRSLTEDVNNIQLVAIDTPATDTTFSAAANTSNTQLAIIPRSAWGADESLRRNSPAFAPISKLIVHHTVTDNGDSDPAATVRGIYQYHVQGNGWDDIGYNFLIDEAGQIYEGRYARDYSAGETPTGEDVFGNGVVGAHALGVNAGSCGVALLGTYTTQGPTQAAINSLIELFVWKASSHFIDANASGAIFNSASQSTVAFPNVAGHRDTYQTECPGSMSYAQLGAVRAAVAVRATPLDTDSPGYWIATRDGAVLNFGAPALGSMAGRPLNKPIVAISTTPSGEGYTLVASDGGLFTFGDAQFFGSMGGQALNSPMVGIAYTSSGNGYWTVAADGGVFSYGDAQFFGSMGGQHLNKPIVGIASTTSGNGYWLVASDGGIFSYGDAQFFGSTGSINLVSPVVAMRSTASGNGYYLVAADGGVFCYGDAEFFGSMGGQPLNQPIVDIVVSNTGAGYYLIAKDGGVFTYGDAVFRGSQTNLSGNSVAIGAGTWEP